MTHLRLSEREKIYLNDALLKTAQFYIEKAHGWLNGNGEPYKGFDSLVSHYYSKADILLEISNKLGE